MDFGKACEKDSGVEAVVTRSSTLGSGSVSVALERGNSDPFLVVLCFAVVVRGCGCCFVVNACERGDSLVWVGLERQGVSGLWESLRKRLGSRSRRHEVVNVGVRVLFRWRLDVRILTPSWLCCALLLRCVDVDVVLL